jgi:hypothetical protein
MNNKLATRFTSVVFLTVSKLALNDSRQTHDGVFEAKNAPDMRILVGTVDHLFDDANGLEDSLKAAILDKNSYAVSQRFGGERRTKESDGIVFPSVSHRNGSCVAAFWPNVVGIPV